MTATRAHNLIIKENNLDLSVENVDIPTSFDGTQCLHRWNASRAFVIAIAEKTAQVIDVFDVVIDVTRCMYPMYLIEVGKEE